MLVGASVDDVFRVTRKGPEARSPTTFSGLLVGATLRPVSAPWERNALLKRELKIRC